MTHSVGRTFSQKFQLPSSSGLGLTVFEIYFHKPSLTELMNDGGDCRTAPATPGLLIIFHDKGETV